MAIQQVLEPSKEMHFAVSWINTWMLNHCDKEDEYDKIAGRQWGYWCGLEDKEIVSSIFHDNVSVKIITLYFKSYTCMWQFVDSASSSEVDHAHGKKYSNHLFKVSKGSKVALMYSTQQTPILSVTYAAQWWSMTVLICALVLNIGNWPCVEELGLVG